MSRGSFYDTFVYKVAVSATFGIFDDRRQNYCGIKTAMTTVAKPTYILLKYWKFNFAYIIVYISNIIIRILLFSLLYNRMYLLMINIEGFIVNSNIFVTLSPILPICENHCDIKVIMATVMISTFTWRSI